MMNWDYPMNGWMGGWMWIPTVLIVALLILGAIVMIRGMSVGTSADADEPLTTAARRFARGEISKEEYETLRATLAVGTSGSANPR